MNIAVVTGAGGGIGSAVCKLLSSEGYQVAALDLAEPGLKKIMDDQRVALSAG